MVNWQAAAENWMLNIDKFKTKDQQADNQNHLKATTDKNYAEPL
jgi:hypothetical protein